MPEPDKALHMLAYQFASGAPHRQSPAPHPPEFATTSAPELTRPPRRDSARAHAAAPAMARAHAASHGGVLWRSSSWRFAVLGSRAGSPHGARKAGGSPEAQAAHRVPAAAGQPSRRAGAPRLSGARGVPSVLPLRAAPDCGPYDRTLSRSRAGGVAGSRRATAGAMRRAARPGHVRRVGRQAIMHACRTGSARGVPPADLDSVPPCMIFTSSRCWGDCAGSDGAHVRVSRCATDGRNLRGESWVALSELRRHIACCKFSDIGQHIAAGA
ncbi:hypothetical protein PsYK624_094860 [Phanerochaete sordida]|uniref:Uncharacterized protein n=1 Tax=Phanerochaete sordida TaxID=48140 RepID=A0A9P3LGQ2_9APHY|nr:hypothetical protein PsYK624_094860 [Phanerochaete sordida]